MYTYIKNNVKGGDCRDTQKKREGAGIGRICNDHPFRCDCCNCSHNSFWTSSREFI